MNTLKFEAIPEFHLKDFGKPPTIPQQISNIITPTLSPDGIFIDYKKYLEMALLLNEDTLLHFLLILKKHLEDIQIFLGEIDGWLLAESLCVEYIKNTFQTDSRALELLESPGALGCDRFRCGKSHIGLTCVHCNEMHNPTLDRFRQPLRFSTLCLHSYIHPTAVLLKSSSTRGEHNHTFDISEQAQQDKLKKFLDFVS
jgi:hypothetical protein